MFHKSYLKKQSDKSIEENFIWYQRLLNYLDESNNMLPIDKGDFVADPHSADYPCGHGFYIKDGTIRYGYYEMVPGAGYAKVDSQMLKKCIKKYEIYKLENLRRKK